MDRAVDGPEAAMDLMKEYPTLIKRPILSSGRLLIVGFDADEYAAGLTPSAP